MVKSDFTVKNIKSSFNDNEVVTCIVDGKGYSFEF